MAKKKSHKAKKSTEPRLGLDLKEFRVAAEAVQALEKDRKILVLSSPNESVRFVDDADHFARAYLRGLGTTATQNDVAREALEEIRGFLQLALCFQKEEWRLGFLGDEVYGQAFKELSAAHKKRLQIIWKDKFKIIEEQPMYRRLSQRAERLKTALTPCIVDADAELVRTRRPGLSKHPVAVPFLRVSLSCEQHTDRIALPSFMSGHPWKDRTELASNKTFQFECDESDIDLLIRRLLAAKVLLAGELDRRKSEGVAS